MEKITNKTIIDFKTFRDYYFLNLRRNRLILFLSTLGMLSFILILIALAYNIFNYYLNHEAFTSKTFTPTIIITSLIVFYYGILYTHLTRNYFKNKESFSKPIYYTFEEEKMIVSVGGSTRERTILEYRDIIGVFENKKYLVIALKNKRSTLVRKDAFNSVEHSKIISEILGEMMNKLTNESLNAK